MTYRCHVICARMGIDKDTFPYTQKASYGGLNANSRQGIQRLSS